MATGAPTVEATEGCGSATLSIDYEPFTTATLASWGWDFVLAEVDGFAAAIFNTHDGKRPPGFGEKPSSPYPDPSAETMIYTPVDVLVVQAINGPLLPGPNQFGLAGGTAGCYTMRVYPSPIVDHGSRYVFILTPVRDASGVNELSLLEAKFAWPVDAEGTVATVDGPMSIDELIDVVSGTAPSPEPPETGTEPKATATT